MQPSPSAAKSSFIDFRKGETINPYKKLDKQRQQPQQEQNSETLETSSAHLTPAALSTPSSQDTDCQLDPFRPPIVRLTEQSTKGDNRFLKARLRDASIMRVVRLYLAYMKDQPPTTCVDGMTTTSIRLLLASEGLPTAPDHLQRIYNEVHQEYGLNPTEASADLHSYRQYLTSERIRRLQQLRESSNQFYSPCFRKQ